MTYEIEEGVALVVSGPPRWSADSDSAVPPGDEATLLTMDREGAVTVYSGKVEYGQGIRSDFARAVADELDMPVSSVEVVLGDTRRVPYDRGTTGSASTRTVGAQLRRAAATARAALVELAIERLKVAAEQLVASDGKVSVAGESGRAVTYAELLPARTLRLDVAEQTATKAQEEFRVIGRPAPRLDAVSRVTGAAIYSQDVVLDGMLHGKILRPPSYGATLQQIDTTRAGQVPGFVTLVQDGDFVGVVAEREDEAEYALDAIRARWQESRDDVSDWSLPALLKERAKEMAVLREEGSIEDGFDAADHVLESVYFVPYVSNAAMEPSAAVASWSDDELTVWVGNRGPFSDRAMLAKAFGLDEDRVHVITTEIGGSFGTKSDTVAYEAARLAKTAGRPVRVAWSRTEQFVWSTVRPAALIEIRSGFTSAGDIVAWDYTAYHAGDTPFRGRRGADTPYDVPNVRVSVANSESPLKSGSYRSLGGAINHFAREVHLDEIAARLEADPVELRLRNLTHPRFRRVLKAAVEKFGWKDRRAASSSGVGVALGFDVGSYVAECVELAVEGREVRVERVTAAFDCGLVVNPDGVRNQVEGSIMMGIGTALWEAVEFDGGRVLNAGFSRYRVPRITDAPRIDVELVGDPETPPTGAGEPAIVPIAAAVANAVLNATGTRIESLPVTPQLS